MLAELTVRPGNDDEGRARRNPGYSRCQCPLPSGKRGREVNFQTQMSRKILTAAALLQVGLAGCSTPQRMPAVPETLSAQAMQSQPPVRYLVSREFGDLCHRSAGEPDRERQWLAGQGRGGALPPAYFLAISGGGDNGAYGAGFLNGWTANGTRPEFKVVTGMSTGALIAPFAFLGPRYDYVLQRVYTTTAQKGHFQEARPEISPSSAMQWQFRAPCPADRQLCHSRIPRRDRRRICEGQGAAGRNDQSRHARAGDLEHDGDRRQLRPRCAHPVPPRPPASASIPWRAFPPVMIDVNADGRQYQEMHVDGGTVAQVFLYPPTFSLAGAPERKRVLYIICNSRMDADWASTERRTMSIAMRSIDLMIRTQGIGDLYRIYATSQRDGLDFNLTYIPETFDTAHVEQFGTAYMQSLYGVAFEEAKAGPKWDKHPPGFVAPINAGQ